jgi:hypothetical protein
MVMIYSSGHASSEKTQLDFAITPILESGCVRGVSAEKRQDMAAGISLRLLLPFE